MLRMTSGMFSFFLSFIIFMANTFAQNNDVPQPFRNYREIKINSHSLLLDLQLKYHLIKNVEYLENEFGGSYGDELIRIDCGKYAVDIGFTYGSSEDPSYGIVARKGKKVFSKDVGAELLAVSSSCQFYASGQTDNSFFMRQKFKITENGIQETVQPFYLVDKVCQTSAATTLTTAQCGKGSVVAQLPKGTEVKILLSEWFKTDENDMKQSNCGNYMESYLVSTPFGLVGWVETTKGSISGEPGVPLSCIIYHGD